MQTVSRSLEGCGEILDRVGARLFTPDPTEKAPNLHVVMECLQQLLDEKAPCQGGLHNIDKEVEAEESAEAAKQVIDIVTDLLALLSKYFGPKFEPLFRPVSTLNTC